MSVKKVVSGGQAGVDRAALDYAIAAGIPYGGLVPKDGRTEDGIDLLGTYPGLKEMATSDYPARTRQNVADSDATLIVCPEALLATSRGTLLTIKYAKELGRPYFVSDGTDTNHVRSWLDGLAAERVLQPGVVLNVAGPRGTGWPDGYQVTLRLLNDALGH